MSHSDVKAVLEFVHRIPLEVNPYPLVARRLIQLIEPLPTPSWARWVQRAILLCFVTIFAQSGFLICKRMKMKMFRVLSLDDLGLLNVDVNVAVTGYLVYSALVIIDIVFDEVSAADYHYQGAKIMLYGCKFIVILDCSWVFLWACVCKCASLKWKSSTHSKSFGRRIPKMILWTLRLFFICMLLWPIPIVFYKYAEARAAYEHISHIVLPIVDSLRKSAIIFSPRSYNQSQLLLDLVPVRQTEPLLDELVSSVRLGITVYIIDLGMVCLIYIPFLIFSLRALTLRERSEAYYADTLVDVSVSELRKFRSMSQITRTEWNLMGLHAAIAYMGIVAHVPAFIWQLTLKSNGYFHNPSWILGAQLGSTGPFALTGIVSLHLLSRNANTPEAVPQIVKSSGEPIDESTHSPATCSTSKSRQSRRYPLHPEMQLSLVQMECDEGIRELGLHRAASHPARPRNHGALSEEIIRPPRVLVRSATTSAVRKPVNFHGLQP